MGKNEFIQVLLTIISNMTMEYKVQISFECNLW